MSIGLSAPLLQINPKEHPGSSLQNEATAQYIFILAILLALQSTLQFAQVSNLFTHWITGGFFAITASINKWSSVPVLPFPGMRNIPVRYFPFAIVKGALGATYGAGNLSASAGNSSS